MFISNRQHTVHTCLRLRGMSLHHMNTSNRSDICHPRNGAIAWLAGIEPLWKLRSGVYAHQPKIEVLCFHPKAQPHTNQHNISFIASPRKTLWSSVCLWPFLESLTRANGNCCQQRAVCFRAGNLQRQELCFFIASRHHSFVSQTAVLSVGRADWPGASFKFMCFGGLFQWCSILLSNCLLFWMQLTRPSSGGESFYLFPLFSRFRIFVW